ncbi:response regulator [Segetibacter koreensis]|uniref:response regulator n=1 Tax=Segetibacter koreensis TaxID=398037 RepID=UPI0003629B03|nr:response regulator [Segetibacter koreensis]
MKKPLDILLIEDDMDDIDLLKDAFEDNKVPYHMEVIMDGDKVSGYLESVETLPEIIVMDLNLPKIDGKEILLELKSSFYLTDIPIIVLTTSSSREDIDYCNNMGIRKFITKPASIDGWNSTIHSIINVAKNFPS